MNEIRILINAKVQKSLIISNLWKIITQWVQITIEIVRPRLKYPIEKLRMGEYFIQTPGVSKGVTHRSVSISGGPGTDMILDSRERLRLMYLHLMDMISARGYKLDHEFERYARFQSPENRINELDNEYFNLKGIAVHHKTGCRLAYQLLDNDKSGTFTPLLLINEAQVGYDILHEKIIQSEYRDNEIHKLILVTDKPLQSQVFPTVERNTEIFLVDELLIDPTKHVLVPKHYHMTETEKTVFLRMTGLQESQLPGMHIFDAMTRYYGAKLGDMFYIQRFEYKNSGVVRSRTYWRIVRPVAEAPKRKLRPPAVKRGASFYKQDGNTRSKIASKRKEIRQLRTINNFNWGNS